jgi:glycosyltransferase involved in cell wall biosynthesis
MPRVTVIIPTYNYARVLPYSIRSALRQTFSDFELLVVGDHCTDESEAVVNSIGDSRVRWINLPKSAGHQSGPNNEGLRQGVGELVAYLGHDDLWLPRHLELAIGNIDGGADLSYGLTEMVRPDGRPPTFEPCELEYQPGMWVPPTSVVHRREKAIELGGWKHWCDLEEIDPETDLWQRMHLAGCRNRLVRMLTAVKFSAAMRKDVYAKQPVHEQAEWSARIEREPDFAAVELARMLVSTQEEGKSFRQSAMEFASETLVRVRKRLWRFGLYRPPVEKKSRVEQYREWRKFKGIKDQNK